jgi:hypothetical protein
MDTLICAAMLAAVLIGLGILTAATIRTVRQFRTGGRP